MNVGKIPATGFPEVLIIVGCCTQTKGLGVLCLHHALILCTVSLSWQHDTAYKIVYTRYSAQ